MTFKIGDRVKRKERGTYLRLSFPGTETGTVVFVREYSDQNVGVHLDIRLDNGEVLRSMADLNPALRSYRFAPRRRAILLRMTQWKGWLARHTFEHLQRSQWEFQRNQRREPGLAHSHSSCAFRTQASARCACVSACCKVSSGRNSWTPRAAARNGIRASAFWPFSLSIRLAFR